MGNDSQKTGRPGNEVVRDQVVRLDYTQFERKSFINCTLVYAGGLPPVLLECDFIDSRFAFEGPALATAQFMAGMANSSLNGKELILSMLGLT